MIRVVLAVALSAALVGIGLPAAEQAERDRNAALATEELERVAETAERLAAENDPVRRSETPAGTTLAIDVPASTFADAGRLRIDSERLRWVHRIGRNRTVVPSVPVRVEDPIVVTDRRRVRLSFVRRDGDAVVRIRPEQPSV